jgi:aminoglycoside/choline kinase family phosphotransferase
MDERLDKIVSAWGLSEIRPLLGDVGTRRYFRVRHKGTEAILVCYPERVSGADDPYQDFIALHKYVNLILRVPEIYDTDDSHRAMLLEDVGDESLESRLMAFKSEEQQWAERVAGVLLDWLGPLTIAAPRDSVFVNRSFDRAKYDFEWSYCKEHFFNGLLKKNPPLWLDREMGKIHDHLIPRAKYLAHRDFHVRNLMVRGSRPVTIDFQDARLGPATYDLASILFDGYYSWSDGAKDMMAAKVQSGLGWDDGMFWGELNKVALQRNFKALGTFAFQFLHKGGTRYAPAIPRTLGHIHDHFLRLSHGEGVIQANHWIKVVERVIES